MFPDTRVCAIRFYLARSRNKILSASSFSNIPGLHKHQRAYVRLYDKRVNQQMPYCAVSVFIHSPFKNNDPVLPSAIKHMISTAIANVVALIPPHVDAAQRRKHHKTKSADLNQKHQNNISEIRRRTSRIRYRKSGHAY